MFETVGIAIPSIPVRKEQLARALTSVIDQNYHVEQINVAVDTDKEGAGATRNRAWRGLNTDWVAFLDDDDELDRHHISTLMKQARADPGAGVIFPWYRILRYGEDVGSLHDPAKINEDTIPDLINNNGDFLPINVLIRRHLLEEEGGFHTEANAGGEDWKLWKSLLSRGIRFSHVPVVTWSWHHWGHGEPGKPGNTSGVPYRW